MRTMMRTCLEVKEFSVHLINDEKGGLEFLNVSKSRKIWNVG